MGICMRYANNKNDAVEIMNDGFLKVFNSINKFEHNNKNVVAQFTAWLSKIMVHTAIDKFRKNAKQAFMISVDDAVLHLPADIEDSLSKLSYDEIVNCIKQLTPAYKTVFNLFVIDGFSHDEISKELGIAVGTSKSNLAKARIQLQKMLSANKTYMVYEG